MTRSSHDMINQTSTREFVTVHVGEGLFGIPVTDIHDVFAPQSITHVPLSSPEIAGVLNLRGRIVTAIDTRCRLGMDGFEPGKSVMAVGVEYKGEAYGLLIDQVGEVMRLADEDFENTPGNLDPVWRQMAQGIYRLEGRLLTILDVQRLLDFDVAAEIAA